MLIPADTPLPGGASKGGRREEGGGAGKLEVDTGNCFFLVSIIAEFQILMNRIQEI